MSLIREIQESLNETPPLRVNIAPSAPPAQTAPQPTPAIPTPLPAPIQAPEPVQAPAPIPSTGVAPQVIETDALSVGETVSKMSADSAVEIQKLIESSGAPKPNAVQSQLLNPNTPVQIDPKLSSQRNPFARQSEITNPIDRLAFEPPVLANGNRNPFSDPNALLALQAGVSKEEYLAYKRDLDNKLQGQSPLINLGIQDRLPNVERMLYDFRGKTPEQIRSIMSSVRGYNMRRRDFNNSFLPFLGENRSEAETLFGVLSLPSNVVRGAGLDLLRGVGAAFRGSQDLSQYFDATAPTRGGTFFGAAVLGENFQSLDQTDGKVFNPLAAVKDDTNPWQVFGASFLDMLSDPLNIPAVESRLLRPFGSRAPAGVAARTAAEVINVGTVADRLQLPQVGLAGVLPMGEARQALPPARTPLVTRTINVEVSTVPNSRVIVTPPNPVQTDRVLVTPPPRQNVLPFTPQPRALPSATSAPIERTLVTPPPEAQLDITRPVLPDLSAIQQTRPRYVDELIIERGVKDANDLAVYRPTEVVFPEPMQPYIPKPDVRVSEPDVAMYNNVVALFDDTPQLPAVRAIMEAVVEQTPVPQVADELLTNPVIREVLDYAETGDLTPNVAVLKGATADEIAAIVDDRIELLRETPMVVPEIKLQPIEVPKLEFDIIGAVPRQPQRVPDPTPTLVVSLDNITSPVTVTSPAVETLARQMVAAQDTVAPVLLERVSPVEFKVLDGELQYAAARRAAEIDPNFELRSVVVEKDTPQFDAFKRQAEIYKRVEQASDVVELDSTSTGAKTFVSRGDKGRTFSIELDDIKSYQAGKYPEAAVRELAENFLEAGDNLRPIVVRRINPTDFEVVRGHLEYLAARLASEINPQFTGVRAFITDGGVNEAALLAQLDALDNSIPAPTTNPVVLSDSVITSLADLQDGVKIGDIEALTELKNWVPEGDFVTPLKQVPEAIEDLEVVALNTPAMLQVVKKGVGKLSDKSVKSLVQSFRKVDIDKFEDVSKSLFNGLWRKSTDAQKEIILTGMSTSRLEALGLSRAKTVFTTPDAPTLSHAVQKISDSNISSLFSQQSTITPVEQNINTLLSDFPNSKVGANYEEFLDYVSMELEIPKSKLGVLLDSMEARGELFRDRAVQPPSITYLPKRDSVVNPYNSSDFDFTSSYRFVNETSRDISDLYQDSLIASGFTRREATSVPPHPLVQEIQLSGGITDKTLSHYLKYDRIDADLPQLRDFNSKLLKDVWDVATPEQRARIMIDIPPAKLEQLGFERIARTNVIDDHLPPETVFDIPC